MSKRTYSTPFISNTVVPCSTRIAYKWRGISPFAHSVPRKLLSLCKQMLMLRASPAYDFASLRAAASAKRFIAASKHRRAAARDRS